MFLARERCLVASISSSVITSYSIHYTKLYDQRKEKEEEQKELLQQLKGKDNVTLDGKQVKLYANIGNSKDLAFVKKNDAGGIGLFRSEFIYLESSTYSYNFV